MFGPIQVVSGRFAGDAFDERMEMLEAKCSGISDDQILTCDLDVLGEQIAESFLFDVPTLLPDKVEQGEEQTIGDIMFVSWHIPYQGDGRLFELYAHSNPIHTISAELDDGWLVISSSVPVKRPLDAENDWKQIVKYIDEYFPEVKRQLGFYNQRIIENAKSNLKRRLAILQRNQEASAKLASRNYPIRKRPDKIAKATIPIERKMVPLPKTMSTMEESYEIEMKAYQDILKTITSMAKVIERTPKTFAKMEEEDFRNVLLVGLNTLYEGQATGETFNGNGKTDILVRAADRNVFIGECLVWAGPEKFNEKIDQLYGYTMWRDAKTALIIFSRNADFSQVITKAREEIAKRPECFKKLEKSETGSSYLFRRKEDSSKTYHLNCLAFNVRSESASS